MLAAAIDTGIGSAGDAVITVRRFQTVHAPLIDLITEKGRDAGVGTVLTACLGITGLCTVAVTTIVTGGVTGLVDTAELVITGVCRAGNSVVATHVTGSILAVTILVTGIGSAVNGVITVPIR